jgi:hypothetical protein
VKEVIINDFHEGGERGRSMEQLLWRWRLEVVL